MTTIQAGEFWVANIPFTIENVPMIDLTQEELIADFDNA